MSHRGHHAHAVLILGTLAAQAAKFLASLHGMAPCTPGPYKLGMDAKTPHVSHMPYHYGRRPAFL